MTYDGLVDHKGDVALFVCPCDMHPVSGHPVRPLGNVLRDPDLIRRSGLRLRMSPNILALLAETGTMTVGQQPTRGETMDTTVFEGEPEVEEKPVAAIRRGQKLAPYVAVVQQSWDNETAMSVIVKDEETAKEAVTSFRSAATSIDKGLAVVVEKITEGDNAGKVKVIVQAKEKRKYTAPTTAPTNGPAPTAAKATPAKKVAAKKAAKTARRRR